MASDLVCLERIEPNSAGATFLNIPQGYTDLNLIISTRYTTIQSDMFLVFNDDTSTNYSSTYVQNAGGTSAGPGRFSNTGGLFVGGISGSGYAADSFSSVNVLIPDYKTSNFKQVIVTCAAENSTATPGNLFFIASLWRGTSAINKIGIGGSHLVGSSFTLYGLR